LHIYYKFLDIGPDPHKTENFVTQTDPWVDPTQLWFNVPLEKTNLSMEHQNTQPRENMQNTRYRRKKDLQCEEFEQFGFS